MNALLTRPCPQCAGTGHLELTPGDAGPYGLTLLHALAHALRHGDSPVAADLPLHPSGNISTRNQALRRLEQLGLVHAEGGDAPAMRRGRFYVWQITPAGIALLDRVSARAAA